MNRDEELRHHRNIGIWYSLKSLKKDGLIDKSTRHPDHGRAQVEDQILDTAAEWYKIGAKRGAIQILKAIQNGDIELIFNENGEMELVSLVKELSWVGELTVNIGRKEVELEKIRYTLEIGTDLGLDQIII